MLDRVTGIGSKLRYFAWAATQYYGADTSCPACGALNTFSIRRKAIVTELFECEHCALRFRIPKDSPGKTEEFYQRDYHQGLTSECPSQSELDALIETAFRGSEKDFTAYLKVLEAVGLKPGSVVMDYGSSWGYGSWQLKRAGYRVYSYEISRSRSEYARRRLGCEVLTAPSACPEKVDTFFSAHVIEHLPNPNIVWQIARLVLKPTGNVVLFMPNGDPALEQRCRDYHKIWGLVHPLVLSARALEAMAKAHGFSGHAYTSPYDLDQIREQRAGTLNGDELLYVARAN